MSTTTKTTEHFPNSSGPVADTQSGRLQGAEVDGINIFRGIPYGASTAGKNRFQPPQPVTPWGGIRSATSNGKVAPQNQPIGDLPAEMKEMWGLPHDPEPSGEDCLVLNVWTPGLDARKRPVMVWFHGGYYVSGSGGWPRFDGANLTRRGDVVAVTVNHRLNVFGYLSLAAIAPLDFPDANVGQLDLVAALQWVRDNIAQFGGDPGNVMIYGQSGGGGKVATLLAMPAARGLFHRAAIMSPVSNVAFTPDQGAGVARALLKHFDIPESQAARLQDVPMDVLRAASDPVQNAVPGLTPMLPGAPVTAYQPVLDGRTLTESPHLALAAGRCPDLPILVGNTRDEASIFSMALLADPASRDMTDTQVIATLASYGSRAPALVASFRKSRPDARPVELMTAINSATFRSWGTAIAEQWLRGPQRSPVYTYLFTKSSPLMGGLLGAVHGVDLTYMFHNLKASASAAEQRLSDVMADAWIAFAREGDPAIPDGPEWSAYNLERRPTMVFDEAVALQDDPEVGERAAVAAAAPAS